MTIMAIVEDVQTSQVSKSIALLGDTTLNMAQSTDASLTLPDGSKHCNLFLEGL